MHLCLEIWEEHHYQCSIKYRCVKYWLNVVHENNNNTLRNSLYKLLKQSDEAGCDAWASEIKLLLCSFGFGYVWHQQGVGNIDLFVCIFKQILVDTAGQNWHIDVTNNCKLNLYSLYKSSLEIEPYLSVDMHWKHRAALARFRPIKSQIGH